MATSLAVIYPDGNDDLHINEPKESNEKGLEYPDIRSCEKVFGGKFLFNEE